MLILGVDPGTVALGYGLISGQENRMQALEHGVLPEAPVAVGGAAAVLREIYVGVKEVISRWHPDAMAVEQLFFCRNTRSAMAVGQARGVVLLAAAEAGLEVLEFTPLEVKMAVTGYGKAEKQQVQYMVKALLGLQETPRPDDAADALAVAICGHRHLSGILRHAGL